MKDTNATKPDLVERIETIKDLLNDKQRRMTHLNEDVAYIDEEVPRIDSVLSEKKYDLDSVIRYGSWIQFHKVALEDEIATLKAKREQLLDIKETMFESPCPPVSDHGKRFGK